MISYDDFTRFARPKLARRFFARDWDLLRTEERATVTAAVDELFPIYRTAMQGAAERVAQVNAMEVL